MSKRNRSKSSNRTNSGTNFTRAKDRETIADIVDWGQLPAFEVVVPKTQEVSTPVDAYQAPKPLIKLDAKEEAVYMKIMKKTNDLKIKKNELKATLKKAVATAKPYAIGAGVAAVGIISGVVVAGIVITVKHKARFGSLVELTGPAADIHLDNNQSAMTPDLIWRKVLLLTHPGTVLINAKKDKRYSLIGGELASVDGSFKGMNAEGISQHYVDAWKDVIVAPITVFLTKVSEQFYSKQAA